MAQRTCPVCKSSFTATTPNRIYCSKRCNRTAYNRRYRRRAHNGQTCTWCNGTFDATKPAKYCSTECQGEAKRWRYLKNDRCEVEYGDCAYCGQVMVARAGRLYCSEVCKSRRQWNVPLGWWLPRRCERCGFQFDPNHSSQVFCDRSCSRAEHKARRRALERSGASVNRLDVFRRDKWICQLCGVPVDRKARVPNPRSATIDHIVPISLGGPHHPANVQTAHWVCNSIKGNRTHPVGEQLRLVG